MKIAFSGCRNAHINWATAYKISQIIGEDDEVLVGDCPTGIDLFVREFCKEREVPFTVFVADWNKYGRAAGPIRNGQMVEEADLLIAFWDGNSKGTLSAITQAVKKKLRVKIYPL